MNRSAEIALLRDLGEEIKNIKNSGEINSHEIIEKYLDWRERIEELCEDFFIEDPDYLIEFKKLPREGNGYTLIGNVFPTQLAISARIFRAMEKHSKGLGNVYERTAPEINEAVKKSNPSKGKIFISHNSENKSLAENFIQMFTTASALSGSDFICSSVPGSKLESGKSWTQDIVDSIAQSFCLIALVTEEFKNSSVSYWEVGLAHGKEKTTYLFLKNPITIEKSRDFFKTFHLDNIESSDSLDRLKDFIEIEKNIKIDTSSWNKSKKYFLEKINTGGSSSDTRRRLLL